MTEMKRKTSYYFELHKTFYTIKIDYLPKKKKIKITVQANISNEIYFIRLYEEKLPLQLAFYGTMDNIYLALEKSNDLSFNIQQKCFELSDLINDKPRKISLKMRKRKTSLIEKSSRKVSSKRSKLYKELEQQMKQLKSRYDQAQKQIESLMSMVKEGQKQLLSQQNELLSERRKTQEIQMQNEQLRKYCRFYKRRFPEYTKQFDIYVKIRKYSDSSSSKVQTPSPELTKQVIIEEPKVNSKVQIKSVCQSEQNQDSFLFQIDQAQFAKTLKSKK